MTPVMTSTKTDKLAIDLAGVDAGAKMLVVPAVGSVLPLAQATAGRSRKAAACATVPNLDDVKPNTCILAFTFYCPRTWA